MRHPRMRGIGVMAFRSAVLMACVAILAACGDFRAPEGGTVLIESAPEQGATVFIAGEPVGETPFVLEGMPPGRMIINVGKSGYKPSSEMVEIPRRGEQATQTITMRPLEAFLSVESTPPGAEVTLEGRGVLGQTPMVNRPIPAGENSYEIRLENYLPETNSFNAETDFRYQFTHSLRPMPARLRIVSNPPLASIWINEDERASTTPAEFELATGLYRVAVHTEGHIMAEEVIELGPNDQRELEFALEPGSAPRGMVLIPAGEFIFGVNEGSPDERPQQRIQLPAFYIDRYEVTNAQFRDVFPNHSFAEGMENHPVTGVSYRMAEEFARRVGKRLPTEKEWEKAARGTDGRQYPWGNTFRMEFVNSSEQPASRDAELRAVGQFQGGASPYGVMDMAGNAYEWTASWYGPYPGNEDIKTEYGQIYRVLRGGSYRTGRFDVRVTRRHFNLADATRGDYGFRCAMDVPEDAGTKK
jgi:formylglycine-generating enzyme required for sulfatase activity